MAATEQWVLYLDQSQNFPYWYHAASGESRWATDTEAADFFRQQHHHNQGTGSHSPASAPDRRPEYMFSHGTDAGAAGAGRGGSHAAYPTYHGPPQQHVGGARHVGDASGSEYSDDDDDDYDDYSDEDEDDDDSDDDDYSDDDDSDDDDDDIEASNADDSARRKQKEEFEAKIKGYFPNEGMETAFQRYLQTPEGKAAMESEQEHVGKEMDVKEAKERRLAAREGTVSGRANKKGKARGKKATFAMAAESVLRAAWAPASALLGSIGSLFVASSSGARKKKATKRRATDNGAGKIPAVVDGGDDADEVRPVSATAPSPAAAPMAAPAAAPTSAQARGRNRFRHETVDDEEEGGVGDDDEDEDEDGDSVSSDEADAAAKKPLFPSWREVTATVEGLFTRASAASAVSTASGTVTTASAIGDGDATTDAASGGPGGLWDTVSATTVDAAKKIGSASVETVQWALQRTGAGMAVVGGAIWQHVNAALARYVNDTIDSGNRGIQAQPPSRERALDIAPVTMRDAMAP